MPVGTSARPPPGASVDVLAGHEVERRRRPAGRRRAAGGRGRGGRRARRARVELAVAHGRRSGRTATGSLRPVLVWMDLEMTGLDPARDVIVEIATLVTDDELEIVAEGPDLVVHQPAEALADDGRRRAGDAHPQRPARRDRRRRRSPSRRRAPRRSRSSASTCPSRAPCRCAATRSAPTGASSPPTCPRSRSYLHYRSVDVSTSRSWPGAGTPSVLAGRAPQGQAPTGPSTTSARASTSCATTASGVVPRRRLTAHRSTGARQPSSTPAAPAPTGQSQPRCDRRGRAQVTGGRRPTAQQEQEPAPEDVTEVAPGILRVQLPIAMPGLGHVNCYVLEDERGVAIVDPGHARARSRWQALATGCAAPGSALKRRPHGRRHPLPPRPLRRRRPAAPKHRRRGRDPRLFRTWFDPTSPTSSSRTPTATPTTAPVAPPRRRRPTARRRGAARHFRPPLARCGSSHRVGAARWFAPPTPDRSGVDDAETITPRPAASGSPSTRPATPPTTCACSTRPTASLLSGDHVLPTITPHISAGCRSTSDPLAQFFDSLERVRRPRRRQHRAAGPRPPVRRPRRAGSRPSASTTSSGSTGPRGGRGRAAARPPCRESQRGPVPAPAPGGRWPRARPTPTSSTCASPVARSASSRAARSATTCTPDRGSTGRTGRSSTAGIGPIAIRCLRNTLGVSDNWLTHTAARVVRCQDPSDRSGARPPGFPRPGSEKDSMDRTLITDTQGSWPAVGDARASSWPAQPTPRCGRATWLPGCDSRVPPCIRPPR